MNNHPIAPSSNNVLPVNTRFSIPPENPASSSTEEATRENQNSGTLLRRVRRGNEREQLSAIYNNEIRLSDDLSAIEPHKFGYLTQEIAHALVGDQMAQLTVLQVMEMSPSVRFSFRPRQVARINSETWRGLDAENRNRMVHYHSSLADSSDSDSSSNSEQQMQYSAARRAEIYNYLIELPGTHLVVIGNDIFEYFRPEEILQILSPDKISYLTPERIVQICKDWTHLTPAHVRALDPGVFKLASPRQLMQLSQASRLAISEAQLSQIEIWKMSDRCILHLSEEQIRWLGARVSEIRPDMFQNAGGIQRNIETRRRLHHGLQEFENEITQRLNALPTQLPAPAASVLVLLRETFQSLQLIGQARGHDLDARNPAEHEAAQQQLINAQGRFTTQATNYLEQVRLLEDSPLKQQIESVYTRILGWEQALQQRAIMARGALEYRVEGDAWIARFLRALDANQITELTGQQMEAISPTIWGRIRDRMKVEAQEYAEVQGHAQAMRQAYEECLRGRHPIEWEMKRYSEIIRPITEKFERERFIQLAKEFMERVGPIRFLALPQEVKNVWSIPNWGNVIDVMATVSILSTQSLRNYSKEAIRGIPDAVLEHLKEKGIPFLEKLSGEQVDWLAIAEDGTRRILPYSPEEIQAARIRQPGELFTIASRYLTPSQIEGAPRETIWQLTASSDWIASASPELLTAVVRKYINDPELLNAGFYIRCAQNAKFHVISAELRQRIPPAFFEKFTLDNFWVHLFLWESPNFLQMDDIIRNLTSEQISKCLSLFKIRGTSLLPFVSANAMSGVPAEAFRYLGRLPMRQNATGRYIDLTPEQVSKIIPKQWINMPFNIFLELAKSPLRAYIPPAALEQLPYSHYALLHRALQLREISSNNSFSKIWTPEQYGKLPERLFAEGLISIQDTPLECLPELTTRQFLAGMARGPQVTSLRLESISNIKPEVFALLWKPAGSLLPALSEDIVKNLPLTYYEALAQRVTQAGESFETIWSIQQFQALPAEIFARGLVDLRQMQRLDYVNVEQLKAWTFTHGNNLKWMSKGLLQTLSVEILNSTEILLKLNATQMRSLKIDQLRSILRETLRDFILRINNEDPANDPRIKYLKSKNILTEENIRIARMNAPDFSQLDLATIESNSISFIHPDRWKTITLEDIKKLQQVNSKFGIILTEESKNNLLPDPFAEIFYKITLEDWETISEAQPIKYPAAVTSSQWNALMSRLRQDSEREINIRPIDIPLLSTEAFKNGSADFFSGFSKEMWKTTTPDQRASIPVATKRELLILLEADGQGDRIEQIVRLGLMPEDASDYIKMTAAEFASKSLEECQAISGRLLAYLSPEVYANLTLEQARGFMRFPDVFQIPREQLSAILEKYPALIEPFYSEILSKLSSQDLKNFWGARFQGDTLAPNFIRNLSNVRHSELVDRGLLRQEQLDIAKVSAADFSSRSAEFFREIPRANIYFIVPEAWRTFSEEQWKALKAQHGNNLISLLASPQFAQLSPAWATELLLSCRSLSTVPLEMFRDMTLEQWEEWIRQPGFSLEGMTGPQLRAIPQNIIAKFGIKIQFKLNSNQYWLLKNSQQDRSIISSESIQSATAAELELWNNRSPKNGGWSREELLNQAAFFRATSLLEKSYEELAQMSEARLRMIPSNALEAFAKYIPRKLVFREGYKMEVDQAALDLKNRKIRLLVEKGIISEADVQAWVPRPALPPAPIESPEPMDDSEQRATAPKRKASSSAEAPPNKQPKQKKTVVWLIESEAESAQQKQQKEKAVENYQQKQRPGEVLAYKVRIRANSVVEYLQYHLQSRTYQALEGPPQDLGPVQKHVFLGETINHKIANIDATELGGYFKHFNRNTTIHPNPEIVLLACELPTTYVSEFFREVSTEEVNEGASASSSRRINQKYANLKVTSYLYPMLVSETGQRLVKSPDGKLYHGHPSAKFIFERDDTQPWGIKLTLQSTQGDQNIVAWTPEHAGPLGDGTQQGHRIPKPNGELSDAAWIEAVRQAEAIQRRELAHQGAIKEQGSESVEVQKRMEYGRLIIDFKEALKKYSTLIGEIEAAARIGARGIGHRSKGILILGNKELNLIDPESQEIEKISGIEANKIKSLAQLRQTMVTKMRQVIKFFQASGHQGMSLGMQFMGMGRFVRSLMESGFEKMPLSAKVEVVWAVMGMVVDGAQNLTLAGAWAAPKITQFSRDLGQFSSALEQLMARRLAQTKAIALTRFTIDMLRMKGLNLANGAVKFMQVLNNALTKLNGAFLIGSLILDIHKMRMAGEKGDKELLQQAGISFGFGLGMGLALLLKSGPLGIVIGVASLGYSLIEMRKEIVKIDKALGKAAQDALLALKKMYGQPLKTNNGILRLDHFRIESLDMEGGSITLRSPMIEGHRLRLNTGGFDKQITESKNFFEIFGIPRDQTIEKSELDKINVVVLPTGREERVIIQDGSASQFLHTGGSDLTNQEYQSQEELLRRHNILTSVESGGGGIGGIEIEDRKEENKNKPITIQLSKEENPEKEGKTYMLPDGAGKTRYIFKTHIEGNTKGDIIQNFQPGMQLIIKDDQNIQKGSTIQILIMKMELFEPGSVRIEERNGKKILVLQEGKEGEKKEAEIDISEITHSRLRISGNRNTWNIPLDGPIEKMPVEVGKIEKVAFRGAHTTQEVRSYLSALKNKGRIEELVIVERSERVLPVPPTFSEGEHERNRRDKQKQYLGQLKQYQKEVRTSIYYRGRYIYSDELEPGAKIINAEQIQSGQNKNVTYLQAEKGILQRLDEYTNQESRILLPLIHPESEIRNIREGEGNQITSFEYIIPYQFRGKRREAILHLQREGEKYQLTKVSGILGLMIRDATYREIQHLAGATTMPMGQISRHESLYSILTRLGIGEIGKERGKDMWHSAKWVALELENENKEQIGKLYLQHPDMKQIINVQPDEELLTELSEGEERGLVLHSSERKTALFVKVPKTGTYIYESRRDRPREKIEYIEKSANTGEVYLISENYKTLSKWNPFKNTIQAVELPSESSETLEEIEEESESSESVKESEPAGPSSSAIPSPNEVPQNLPPASEIEPSTSAEEFIVRIPYGEKGAITRLKFGRNQDKWQLEEIGPLTEEATLQVQQELKQAKANQLRTEQEARTFVEQQLDQPALSPTSGGVAFKMTPPDGSHRMGYETNRGNIKFEVKYENGRRVKLDILSVTWAPGERKSRDFNSALLNALKISSIGSVQLAPWVRVTARSGTAGDVNTKDLRFLSAAKDSVLVDHTRGLLWNAETKTLSLLPNVGSELIPALGGKKVERPRGSSVFITTDGREIIRGLGDNAQQSIPVILSFPEDGDDEEPSAVDLPRSSLKGPAPSPGVTNSRLPLLPRPVLLV